MLEQARGPRPVGLGEEGRVMVLRALLLRQEAELQLFHRSARRAGFARQLSRLSANYSSTRSPPASCATGPPARSCRLTSPPSCRDLAVLLQAARQWSDQHHLQDGHHLLDLAAERLHPRRQPPLKLSIGHLWLDGFAE